MVAESTRRAWQQLGFGLAETFERAGQQRARRAEFDAQLAQNELARRDANDARAETAEINRRYLEITEEKAALDVKRYDEDQEREVELLELSGAFDLGQPDIPAAGRIAGQQYGAGIRQADGFLPKIRAAVAGFAPALQKGASEAPRTPFDTGAEAAQKLGLSREQTGLLREAIGSEAFEGNRLEDVKESEEYSKIAFKAGIDSRVAALREGITDEQELVDRSWKTGWAAIVKQYPELDTPFFKEKFTQGINEAKVSFEFEKLGLTREQKGVAQIGKTGGRAAIRYAPDQILALGGDLSAAQWKSLGVDPANEEQKALVRKNVIAQSNAGTSGDFDMSRFETPSLDTDVGSAAGAGVNETVNKMGGIELAATIQAALGEKVSREAAIADLVETYGLTDASAATMVDRVVSGEWDEQIAAFLKASETEGE